MVDRSSADTEDVDLRLLVDIVWQHATESTAVPFHKTSDMLIAKYRQCFPRVAQTLPERSCSDPNCRDPNCNYDNEPAPDVAQQPLDREQIAAVLYVTRYPDMIWGHAGLWETAAAYKQADAILSLVSSTHGETP